MRHEYFVSYRYKRYEDAEGYSFGHGVIHSTMKSIKCIDDIVDIVSTIKKDNSYHAVIIQNIQKLPIR